MTSAYPTLGVTDQAAEVVVARLTDGGLRLYARPPGARPRLKLLVNLTEAQARQLLADLAKVLDQ